jgi:outer membrane protein TolC
MNKFAKTLSASDKSIKEARAQMLADTTILEVDAKVSNLKREVNSLKNKITQLTDLAPDNTYSLRPGGKDYNPVKWIEELHQAKLDLKLKAIELEVAEEIKSEWFSDEA